ncbi:MAG: insulinase family protein [Betaproteobacteria bacterium]|nr:insulinase family protein [Betaproteobacteria bacterium]
MRLFRLIAVCLAFLAAPAIAQTPLPKGVTKVTSVEGITEYRLENGLKVLLFPDLSKPTITVNITYLVGSRHENYGETGMAHLLEHLMFKGTPKNPDLDKQFNQRGARSNGTTWLDRTNYFELFQATDDNLKWAIDMEADRMVNSFIRKSDLDTEMTVVRNEYEMGENSPFSVLIKRLQSVAYDWHSYGRSTIGNRSDIENVKEANLQAFYRLYYQPDNAVLLVAGKFDEAKALALIANAFGKIAKPTRKLPEFWTVEPTQDGERQFDIRRKGDVQIVAVAYKVPSALHPDSDGLGFANFILTDTPTGRLHKALVETGKAAQVFGFPLTGFYPGLQIFGAVVKKGDPLEPVRDEMIGIIEGFGDHPATVEEIARARKSQENEAEKTLANHESIGVQLSEYIALGDWRLFFKSREDLAKVTSEAVAKASKAYFRRDNRIVGLYLPEDNPQRAEIPAAPTVAQVMKDFKGKAETSVAEAFDPSQANIDARTTRMQFGGLKVALLAKKTRGETVNVSLSLHMGDEKSLVGQKVPAQIAGQMLTRGTTKYTRTQLSDELERLKVSGRVGGSGGSFQTTRPNLEAALRLAAHILKEPSFPESEFEQLRNQTITGIQAQLSEPNARASEAISKHFNAYPKDDFRYSPSLEESLANIKGAKLEDAKRFHREFYGASAAEIAIVGDFDEAKAAALLKDLFEGWKSQKPFAHLPIRFTDVAPANLSVPTPDKENAIFLARQNIDMRDDDSDYAALYIANYILGGGAGLDSRLGNRLRQKEGLSYSAGSGLNVPSIDRSATWSAYAIAAPKNVAKVEVAFKEELARALAEGFTQAELANAKSGAMQQRVQARAQDGTLAGGWTYYLHLGRTFAFSKAFEDKLMALSVADLNAALRKHLDPSKVTIVKAGDFSKK